MDLSPVDKAFVDQVLPENGMPLGFFAVVGWLGDDGKTHWKTHAQFDDISTSQVVGWLDIAKTDLSLSEVIRNRRRREE